MNNYPPRFENAAFDDKFQLPFNGTNDGSNASRSNWQPARTGAWRLSDCRVTRACRSDGTAAGTAAADGAVGLLVNESRDRSSSKIVDLDPDQQGVSMIFGLAVCLIDARGNQVLKGDFEPAAFFDLRGGRSSGGGDAGRSAYFQSVLVNVEWGDVSSSVCLAEMKNAGVADMLSIRFITDGYNMSGARRGYGRIVGTCWPLHPGRAADFCGGPAFKPAGEQFAHVDCHLDPARRKVLVDVGNSLPMRPGPADFADVGDISLAAGTGHPRPALSNTN